MKRTILFAMLLAMSFGASAQTGLYKRYAHRPGVQAYCVERYPLSSGDSVCVTLLQTDDSAVYQALRRELHKLPFTTKRLHIDGTISIVSTDTTKQDIPEGVMRQMKQMRDSVEQSWSERKHLVIFNADGLPGDKGYYAIYCPSDRMVFLAFLVTGDAEALKVAGHMMDVEFKQ